MLISQAQSARRFGALGRERLDTGAVVRGNGGLAPAVGMWPGVRWGYEGTRGCVGPFPLPGADVIGILRRPALLSRTEPAAARFQRLTFSADPGSSAK